jgi:hypothetical protein
VNLITELLSAEAQRMLETLEDAVLQSLERKKGSVSMPSYGKRDARC